jgi:hypothetical protein
MNINKILLRQSDSGMKTKQRCVTRVEQSSALLPSGLGKASQNNVSMPGLNHAPAGVAIAWQCSLIQKRR